MSFSDQESDLSAHSFTLLTNHAHVLVYIAQRPDVRMREIASVVGITERAVQRIVDDLTSTGFIVVRKDGRRNRYEIQPELPLRHPLDKHRTVGDLIRLIVPEYAGPGFSQESSARDKEIPAAANLLNDENPFTTEPAYAARSSRPDRSHEDKNSGRAVLLSAVANSW